MQNNQQAALPQRSDSIVPGKRVLKVPTSLPSQ